MKCRGAGGGSTAKLIPHGILMTSHGVDFEARFWQAKNCRVLSSPRLARPLSSAHKVPWKKVWKGFGRETQTKSYTYICIFNYVFIYTHIWDNYKQYIIYRHDILYEHIYTYYFVLVVDKCCIFVCVCCGMVYHLQQQATRYIYMIYDYVCNICYSVYMPNILCTFCHPYLVMEAQSLSINHPMWPLFKAIGPNWFEGGWDRWKMTKHEAGSVGYPSSQVS